MPFKTFPDFLFYYISELLTPEWGNAEIKRPLSERHIIMQWYQSLCEFQKQQGKNEKGFIPFPCTGPAIAYMSLAYDLYILKHHSALQEYLIPRLKDTEHFQGARHELFVAATMIRAGFNIRHENERDNLRRHAEFVATHHKTGIEIDVEAKSKKRTGVLGYRGDRKSNDRVGVRRLLKDAVDKFQSRPFMIFVDLNLPSTNSDGNEKRIREISHLVNKMSWLKDSDHKDRFNLLAFTNFPAHYDANSFKPQGDSWIYVASINPVFPVEDPSVISLITASVEQHGRIPNDFDEDKQI